MKRPARGSRFSLCQAVVWLSLAALPALALADTQAAGDIPADALRAELTAASRLYVPGRPVWVRFTLRNTSDEPLEIPLQNEADGGIALPLELVFGTAAEPAISLAYEQEKLAPLAPAQATLTPAQPTPTTEPATHGTLRLAARGSVGTEVDFREYAQALRYPGSYRLEWRPLAGRAGTATAEFRVESRKDAIIVTDKGKLTFTLLYDQAPRTVENFLDLVRQGFYDGKTFHRIVPNYLIQGGDPKGDGSGIRPDGKLIPAEFHSAEFQSGTLAMARKPCDANSASCQFFITLARVPELDGQYTVFGQARDEESQRTLNQIAAEPTDKRDRPRIPVVIRSINLTDTEDAKPTHLELKPHHSPTSAPAEVRKTKPTGP